MSLLVPVVMAGRYVNVAIMKAEFGWVSNQMTGVVPDVGAPNRWVVARSDVRSVPVEAVCLGAVGIPDKRIGLWRFQVSPEQQGCHPQHQHEPCRWFGHSC